MVTKKKVASKVKPSFWRFVLIAFAVFLTCAAICEAWFISRMHNIEGFIVSFNPETQEHDWRMVAGFSDKEKCQAEMKKYKQAFDQRALKVRYSKTALYDSKEFAELLFDKDPEKPGFYIKTFVCQPTPFK